MRPQGKWTGIEGHGHPFALQTQNPAAVALLTPVLHCSTMVSYLLPLFCCMLNNYFLLQF